MADQTAKIPKISIITVVRNGVATLGQAMESVLGQEGARVEYIVLDGASTDGTQALIEKQAARLAYWHSKKDGGIYDAFNQGLSKATGDWVAFLNADDWYEKGAFQKLLEVIRLNPEAEMICGAMRFWTSDTDSYVFEPRPELLREEMTINHPATWVKRELFEKIGLFDTTYRYSADYDWFLRATLAGVKTVTTTEVLTHMRGKGVSDEAWMKGYEESFLAQCKHLAHGPLSLAELWLKYRKRILRTKVSRSLSRAGLENLVEMYRRYLSVMKKERK